METDQLFSITPDGLRHSAGDWQDRAALSKNPTVKAVLLQLCRIETQWADDLDAESKSLRAVEGE